MWLLPPSTEAIEVEAEAALIVPFDVYDTGKSNKSSRNTLFCHEELLRVTRLHFFHEKIGLAFCQFLFASVSKK